MSLSSRLDSLVLTIFCVEGDEKKPACSKCNTRGEKCEWDVGITFRYSDLGTGHLPVRQPEAVESDSRTQPSVDRLPENPHTHCYGSLGGSATQKLGHIVDMTVDVIEHHAEMSADDEERRSSQSLSSTSTQQRPWTWREARGNLDVLGSTNRQGVLGLTVASEAVNTSSRDRGLSPKDGNCDGAASSRRFTLQSSPDSLFSGDCSRGVGSLDRSPLQVIGHGDCGDHGDHVDRVRAPLPGQTAGICSPNTQAVGPALGSMLNTKQYGMFNAIEDSGLPGISVADLEPLDYLLFDPKDENLLASAIRPEERLPWSSDHTHGYVPADQILAESPDTYATYYPDPTYKELHTVLHQHMVETARTVALTRQATPEPTAQGSSPVTKVPPPSIYTSESGPGVPDPLSKPFKGAKLTNRRELELWQNYVQEIAVWLDMFDMERHFQLKIPLMAKSSGHLRYSILALSARQMERKDPDGPYTESLSLYQEAIELILRELHSLDTAVIASCILLCVLEMMSSSPKAWGRHLDGCAMLLQAAEINGAVGGVRQALFWCFARMDVWGGYLSDTLTKIPTSHWFIPSDSMSVAVSRFKASSGAFDSCANYAVFLCASVVNVLSDWNPQFAQSDTLADLKTSYSARWKALFDLLEDWYRSRPEEMRPLMSCPAALDDQQHPFPIVLYGTAPAINGNQLYHASALLMLQEKPKDIRLGKGHKSIHWHARQICGIAASNNEHGPWINALQPLWIAGKVMSHPTEHQAILDILALIEKETGWATSWRAEDLKEYWGDTDD